MLKKLESLLLLLLLLISKFLALMSNANVINRWRTKTMPQSCQYPEDQSNKYIICISSQCYYRSSQIAYEMNFFSNVNKSKYSLVRRHDTDPDPE